MKMSAQKIWPAVVIFLMTTGVAGCIAEEVTTPRVEPSASQSAMRSSTIQICHKPDESPRLMNVASAAVGSHIGHGDYVARLVVDPQTGDVSDGVHFARITDAIVAARAVRYARNEMATASCRITIDVAAGVYTGSFDANADPSHERFPLILDVPGVTLRGALSMHLDARGRPTGEARNDVSSLVPTRPIAFLPNTEALIVVVSHPDGSQGSGVVIEGFAFQSGRSDNSHGGMGIIALRAQNLVIRGNRFERGLSSAADLRSATAIVEQNYGRQLGASCSFCIAGGEFTVSDNRLADGGLGGIYVSAAVAHIPFSLGAAPITTVEHDILPSTGVVTAAVRNNDVRGHSRLPIGFAVRILAIGPSSSHVPQRSRVMLADNDLIGNTFGIILDAGFPTANTTLRGDVDLSLTSNTIQESCQANLLVGFTRHTGAIGLTTNPYLRASTYRLDLGADLDWDEAWFAHPSGLGNELVVNGIGRANGISHQFNQNTCPGIGG